MNKIMIFAALFAVSTMFVSCDDEKVISMYDLPASSQEFIRTHFPNIAVTHVIRERDGAERTYDVYLANGFSLEFRRNGNWSEVDGHINPVPQSILDLLPVGIVEHVATNFPELEIVSIEREHFGFEIHLTGRRFELKFNHAGDFMGFDD